MKKTVSIFNNQTFGLPLEFEVDYYLGLKNIFRLYQDEIKPYIHPYEYNEIYEECEAILECVAKYYEGFPQQANQIFVEKIAHIIDSNSQFYNKSVLGIRYFDTLNLYRIRKKDQSRALKPTKGSIFHVPFHSRRKVLSTRYSIAGYPCLYLGTTIDLCRIESDMKHSDAGYAAKYKMIRDFERNGIWIRVLDLATKPADLTPKFKIKNVDKDTFVENYLKMYPIIAASSVKANYRGPNYPFVPEYIFSQLIMQWLRTKQNGSSISGIRYFTSRSKNPRIKGYNYVFPTTSSATNDQVKSDYCEVLCKCFELTEPFFAWDFENCTEIEEQLKKMALSEFRGHRDTMLDVK